MLISLTSYRIQIIGNDEVAPQSTLIDRLFANFVKSDVSMNDASSFSGTIAYFSMDVAVDNAIPTYSGGLGVLAGDTLRSAADLQIPMVAVSLLHRKGYFEQRLDSLGNQLESPSKWSPENFLTRLPLQISLSLEGRQVRVGAWCYHFVGITGHIVPLFFLDTELEENDSGGSRFNRFSLRR